MGFFDQKKTTHGSRSSSRSYALRWKQENKRQIIISAFITVALLASIVGWFYQQANKNMYLVDGQSQSVEAPTAVPQVDEHDSILKSQDEIAGPLNNSVRNSDQMFIHRAVPITITADGGTKQYFAAEGSVQDTLHRIGVAVSSEDQITPAISTPIDSGLNIRIVRVDTHTAKLQVKVPYDFVKTSDPSLQKGKTKLIQQGQSGIVVHEIEKVYKDGTFVSKRLVSKSVTRPVATKVLAVGTKPAPKTQVLSASIDRSANAVNISQNNSTQKGGVAFKYKKLLQNVSLTAYSSQEPGMGTRTASGSRVTEGRTIAVDTNVIPMGWWVYIEGVGFRRAEDTGSAIKGNIIDVYYDSLRAANDFGRKKGRTVYVIGPVKPELN
ncbi:uncharacterized protein YabE (DUF348 family)/3D (Asp-Asp-Asp) domain-containing protein [Paenibacillus shirakamiensis]|uniref:Uncharacterized protein YabE (DUF348 family)/3D (Asp-Asp-Asp) domain-containing protein n=1 Tax=Paenibacillus shirakamiensis TaxID=1265935 RepID=A0ABS4JLV2_9BACL|nr:uncharacterized protein YabE (DUF348 family)/3D (Asp-Asp-Asp) domain-containing protein [Paenibacillus shirakamiensis]